MELTAGNLSRSRSSGRPQQLCAGSPVTGLSQKFPPDLRAPASKSLRLGWDFHTSAIFFRSAHAPYIQATCPTNNSHAIPKIDFRWPDEAGGWLAEQESAAAARENSEFSLGGGNAHWQSPRDA
jgi:hypothetical protein